jgi:shikimate kinase
MQLDKPIILIGFKHVGKSTIGVSLAKALNIPFCDLDEQIQLCYEQRKGKKITCREIMQNEGESFFRVLEKESFHQIANPTPMVIACGGGFISQNKNQLGFIIHIRANKNIVFERICQSGMPAFFEKEKNMRQSFNALWLTRKKTYANICHFSVNNSGTVDDAVKKIMVKLKCIQL